MAEFHEDRLEEAVKSLKEAFSDGFQFEDVATVVREATVFAGAFKIPSEEKRALALRLINRVVDETDIPWLPDTLIDPLIKRFAPKLIDLVVDAAKGRVAVSPAE